MWSRTYVCCAIPLYNSGIYTVLAQFLVVSLVTGILCFTAPAIVAVVIPSWGAYILGALCIAIAVMQVVGFFGVNREKPALFKSYAHINAALVSASMLLALAWIILSAVRHSKAQAKCLETFSSQVGTSSIAGTTINTGSVTSGTEICNIWTWVQIGIMGLLFIIVAVCQIYFMIVSSIYSSEQKLDHAKYASIYSAAVDEIRSSSLYPDRASFDAPAAPYAHGGASHARTQSSLRQQVYADDYYYDDQPTPTEKPFVPPAGALPYRDYDQSQPHLGDQQLYPSSHSFGQYADPPQQQRSGYDDASYYSQRGNTVNTSANYADPYAHAHAQSNEHGRYGFVR